MRGLNGRKQLHAIAKLQEIKVFCQWNADATPSARAPQQKKMLPRILISGLIQTLFSEMVYWFTVADAGSITQGVIVARAPRQAKHHLLCQAHSASSATQKTLLKEAPLPYPYQALVRSVSASWNRAITDSETSWDFHRAPGVHTRGRSAVVQGVVHGVHNQISGIPRGR
ncbi:unnamed protein product [Prunus armeniaca]